MAKHKSVPRQNFQAAGAAHQLQLLHQNPQNHPNQGGKSPGHYATAQIVARTKASSKSKASSKTSSSAVKKSHRFRPGTVALREIRRYGFKIVHSLCQRFQNCALSLSAAEPMAWWGCRGCVSGSKIVLWHQVPPDTAVTGTRRALSFSFGSSPSSALFVRSFIQ